MTTTVDLQIVDGTGYNVAAGTGYCSVKPSCGVRVVADDKSVGRIVFGQLDYHFEENAGTFSIEARLGPVNTYLSASKMSTKWMKPMNITSSFSNRENIRR